VLDYHLHLWEHGPRPLDTTLEQLAAYCEQAASQGVVEIAVTEHLHRFRQADAVLGGWWEDEPPSAVRDVMARFWDGEVGADLDRYVEVALAAKAAGLPVVLGLEVDFHRGRMHDVAAVLAGYPFDVLLGSVHWLGAWAFDNVADADVMAEWDVREVEEVWDAYADSLDELADSGVCDVLAHPDLCKVAGPPPGRPRRVARPHGRDRGAVGHGRRGELRGVAQAGGGGVPGTRAAGPLRGGGRPGDDGQRRAPARPGRGATWRHRRAPRRRRDRLARGLRRPPAAGRAHRPGPVAAA
jgi:histidinol phosphatase-like PHP family hydrolase